LKTVGFVLDAAICAETPNTTGKTVPGSYLDREEECQCVLIVEEII